MIEDIDKRLKEIENEKAKLEKEKLLNLVKTNEAFICPKCSRIVIKSEATQTQLSYGLCYGCFSQKRRQEIKSEILKKLKNARIVDVELNSGSSSQIEELIIYKQGMKYTLKAIGDEDYEPSSIIIDKEWKEEEVIIEEEIKPWQKSRKELPLVIKREV